MTTAIRFVAIGDSFTEGVGDAYADGRMRGWADLVATGWASARGEAISYANLAIRGRLTGQIVDGQLEPALALKPTHLSFVGGGNDMLRPGRKVGQVADAFSRVLQRCQDEGVTAIIHTGANPSARLPLSRFLQRRGTELSNAVAQRLAGRADVVSALHWSDEELAGARYWAEDRLHMNTWGHHRVAARVLHGLGVEPPAAWWSPPAHVHVPTLSQAAYYWSHALPWLQRRLTGRSSGDGRQARFSTWMRVEPQG
jgi:lysophospholipase L1-like esterase